MFTDNSALFLDVLYRSISNMNSEGFPEDRISRICLNNLSLVCENDEYLLWLTKGYKCDKFYIYHISPSSTKTIFVISDNASSANLDNFADVSRFTRDHFYEMYRNIINEIDGCMIIFKGKRYDISSFSIEYKRSNNPGKVAEINIKLFLKD